MKCSICGKKVTKSQVKLGDATQGKDGEVTHIECIQDLSRHPDDAHYRETKTDARH